MPRRVHPVQLSDEMLLAECDVRRQRRSGPGGQHRNKVETGVFLTHRATKVSAAATENRSQAANLRTATERLRVNLAIRHRVNINDEDEPHRGWASRVNHGRINVSRQHRDFATMLAEALDFLVAAHHDCAAAAGRLNCTRSQLTKLFKMEPLAIQAVNEERRRRELPPLK